MIVESGKEFLFFFNDTATADIYTLSLHDALPIWGQPRSTSRTPCTPTSATARSGRRSRSEEHTSELQSPDHLVCRLLLEKKKSTIPAQNFWWSMPTCLQMSTNISYCDMSLSPPH